MAFGQGRDDEGRPGMHRSFRTFPLAAALVLLGVLAPAGGAAQPSDGLEPSLIVTGVGEAAEPAAGATLQFVVGAGAYYGIPEFGEGVATEEAPGPSGPAPAGPYGPPSLDEAALTPIVEALEAARVAREDIAVIIPVGGEFFGPFGPGTGQVLAEVRQPSREALGALVEAANAAALQAGLAMLYVGARYTADDCAALQQLAREAAVADARTRADGLVRALGIALGELIQVREAPFGGSWVPEGVAAPIGLQGADACAPVSPAGTGEYGPVGSSPPFDPATAGEVRTIVQVELTFALAAVAGTPAA